MSLELGAKALTDAMKGGLQLIGCMALTIVVLVIVIIVLVVTR